uniref:Uncharacterized protein n=1 Tax=Rhizophora mucronata TaxID=61149 RepID=A0A2P2NW12_RHIMU
MSSLLHRLVIAATPNPVPISGSAAGGAVGAAVVPGGEATSF